VTNRKPSLNLSDIGEMALCVGAVERKEWGKRLRRMEWRAGWLDGLVDEW